MINMDSRYDSISIGNSHDTYKTLDQSLTRFLESLLKANPDILQHIAVKDADKDDTRITFEELNKRSNKLARCLVQKARAINKGTHNRFTIFTSFNFIILC